MIEPARWVRLIVTVLVLFFLLSLAGVTWWAWTHWGWPSGVAAEGVRNDNAIFAGTVVLTVGVAATSYWLSRPPRRKIRRVSPEAPSQEALVERRELMREIHSALLSGGRRAVALTTALEGAGGFGKTTLAHQVMADPVIRRRFPGGVWELTVGRDATSADVARLIHGLVRDLAAEPNESTDPVRAGRRLGEVLDGRKPALLVVDDVWSRRQLDPFLIGGHRSVRLVTTRIPGILPEGVQRVQVDQMTQVEAHELLTRRLPELAEEPLTELAVLTRCWPLLLSLAEAAVWNAVQRGASVRQAVQVHVRLLRQFGPTAFDDTILNREEDRTRLVDASIRASLEYLPEKLRDRFAELALFAEDADVPDAALELLWAQFDLDAAGRGRLGAALAGMSLLASYRYVPSGNHSAGTHGVAVSELEIPGTPVLRLHDVIRDYLRTKHRDDLAGWHARLVDAGRRSAGPASIGTAWWRLPDPAAYLRDRIVFHLIGAGLEDEGRRLVEDLRWIDARIRWSGPAAAEADLLLVDSEVTRAMRRRLALSAGMLAPLPGGAAVTSTLISRLAGEPELVGVVAAACETLVPLILPRWPMPEVADPALRRELAAHQGAVRACAVAPGNRWAVTAGGDGMARIWDLATGQRRQQLAGHEAAVTACAVSPDARWLVTTSLDGTARIWDAATGEQRRVLRSERIPVSPAVTDPDVTLIELDAARRLGDEIGQPDVNSSRSIAGEVWAGSDWTLFGGDFTVADSDAVEPQESDTERAVTGLELWACAVSPDGHRVVTGGADGKVEIWDVATGRLHRQLAAHYGAVLACAVSPDGSWALTAGADGMARMWDMRTFRQLKTLESKVGGLTACAVAPDGTWAIIAAHGGAEIWDVAAGTLRLQLTGHRSGTTGCATSPDGAWALTTGRDGTARIWDATTGRQRQQMTGHRDEVLGGAVAADGTWVVTGSADGTARVWDVTEKQQRRPSPVGHYRQVLACAASPDGERVLTAGVDGTTRLWDAADGRMLHKMHERRAAVTGCSFGPDGAWALTSNADGTTRLWSLTTGRLRYTIGRYGGSATCCAVSPDGHRALVGYADGHAALWRIHTAVKELVLAHSGQQAVRCCAWSSDGQWVLTAGDDGIARMWSATEPDDGQPLRELIGHRGSIRACAISADGGWALTAGDDGTARTWDVATGSQRQMLIGHSGPVFGCALAPTGEWVVTVGRDSSARVWDPETGRNLAAVRVDGGLRNCCHVPGGNDIVLVGDPHVYLMTYLSG